MSDSVTHGLEHIRLPSPSLSPGVCSNSCPLSRWCHPTVSSSVTPFFSCLHSFLTSRSFPISQCFASGGQSIGSSALDQSFKWILCLISLRIDWFDLLAIKGLSRVCSSITIRKHQFFGAQPSLQSNSLENHSFDYRDPCQHSDVSAF